MRPYRTNVRDVPLETGLREEEGWVEMQVQFLIDERSAESTDLVVGRTLLPPGARHERHRHPNCDEFLVVSRAGARSTRTTGASRLRRATSSSLRPGTGTGSTTPPTRTCC